MTKNFDSAILFLIFNRPENTSKVLEKIRQIKPKKLYVSADGPRKNNLKDKKKINETRDIIEKIDWDCVIKKRYNDENLGCKESISQALKWFFENEESGIILEDDCLPHIDFFNFCQELLLKYKNNHDVMAITGNNFHNGKKFGEASYFFSSNHHCWGWASWRRVINLYDKNIKFWPEWKNSNDFQKKISNKNEQKYWTKIFNAIYNNEIDSWAYPFQACLKKNAGLTVTPNVNLVSNIGFGVSATHTKMLDSNLNNMPVSPLKNIIHPNEIKQNQEADELLFYNHLGGKYLLFPFNIISVLKSSIKFFLRKISFKSF